MMDAIYIKLKHNVIIIFFFELPGQILRPICSNSQGIYVVEEGSYANVCFTLYNNNNEDPLRVNVIAESRSTLGTLNILLCKINKYQEYNIYSC
jgi:hypothetical protein